jgi:hypothetical protein
MGKGEAKMTDKNKYVLAEIERLQAELDEANRCYALAYDDEVGYGKDAAMHWGNKLIDFWSMLHALDGRRPDWENSDFLMPVNPAYRELVERGALAGMTPRQIEEIAFAVEKGSNVYPNHDEAERLLVEE